jgi:alkylation response protein AidB-like acyl-CoA dehydrogenase
LLTYALVVEEFARGWMSLPGIINIDDCRVPANRVLGEAPGKGFYQFGQSDVEAGMAKYLAAEYCKEVVEDSLRIHGGYGYSTEHEIERLYRDAPMLLIGEGTAEIQKMIIGRRLVRDYPAGA